MPSFSHNSHLFFITVVYGMNDAHDREALWNRLSIVSTKTREAWMLVGYFNNVLHLNERLGSAVTLAKVSRFSECMRACGLNEHKIEGPFLHGVISKRGRGEYFLELIVIANHDWDLKFPHIVAKFLPESVSDHCPCVIRLDKAEVVKPKAFRLFNMWAADDEFLTKVQGV